MRHVLHEETNHWVFNWKHIDIAPKDGTLLTFRDENQIPTDGYWFVAEARWVFLHHSNVEYIPIEFTEAEI
jgi:hypothetical protein